MFQPADTEGNDPHRLSGWNLDEPSARSDRLSRYLFSQAKFARPKTDMRALSEMDVPAPMMEAATESCGNEGEGNPLPSMLEEDVLMFWYAYPSSPSTFSLSRSEERRV